MPIASLLFLVPPLVAALPPGSVANAGVPGAIEVRPGVFVLQTVPDGRTWEALRAAGITHVLNLRTKGEGGPTTEPPPSAAAYTHCPLEREPDAASLDAFRAQIKALPPQARVLLHCQSGNRVGGALFAYWVLDAGMPENEAHALARKAGLKNPATEAAVKAYLALRMKNRN